MKTFFKVFLIIGLIYFLLIYIISIMIGLPPFNNGYIIGFPAIYYSFDVNPSESQHGFTGFSNILINLILVLFISYIYTKIKKKI
jgi:hypothetical protein